MDKTVCIIPARSGSKRIPGKNLRPLAGKPLISYAVEVALASGIFTDVVVSSDSQELLDVAASLGASTDLRVAELSGDTATVFEVIAEYLSREANIGKYQNIACVLPTCPFCSTEDIKGAYALFAENNARASLISVVQFDYPPQFGFEFLEDDRLKMCAPEAFARSTRSQSMAKLFHNNGAIWISSVMRYLENKTFYAEPMVGYAMPAERSFDIDYPYQFEIAEIMMKKVKNDE